MALEGSLFSDEKLVGNENGVNAVLGAVVDEITRFRPRTVALRSYQRLRRQEKERRKDMFKEAG